MEMFDLSNSRAGLSSVDILYSQQQKVFIKSKKGEEKSRILRITVELKSGLTISVGKVLSLQITDDNDCTFFFSLLLTQEDFSILKSQQGLLVDFDHFPSQLIKLLESCDSKEFNKFILVIDEEDGLTLSTLPETPRRDFLFLKVIERNNFKNLCHLSLKVLQGSDSDIKQHMAAKIGKLKERLSEEERRCRAVEAQLAEAVRAVEGKTRELTEVQLALTEEKNSLRLELSQQVAEERERVSRVQMEWQQKVEMEKACLAKQYQKQISDMNDQINTLTFNNKNLYETKCQFETAVKEKMFHVEALEKQNAQLSQEVNLLRKQNSQLDQDYHEKDKAVVGLRTKLAVVEQELKDKGKYLEKQQELLKVATEQKTFLEEALSEKEASLQRKMAAFQTLSSDLLKSNEIIAKLQADLAANKAKMKLRTNIALEQEKVLEKKTHEISLQAETIKDLEGKLAKLTEELQDMKARLQEVTTAMQEKEAIIKKNENVISWLNRRLTESSGVTSCRSVKETGAGLGVGGAGGGIGGLAKGWPPWLVNSVAGSNSSQADSTGMSNGVLRLSSNSSPADASDQSKVKIHKSDDSSAVENKDPKEEQKAENKLRGLDPKYFQSCTDKDYVVNLQISKANSAKSFNCSSRPNSGREPLSAYFPKKPVPL